MTLLSKEEKVTIIEGRIRSLEYKKYGAEIDKKMENARTLPDDETISKFDELLEEVNNQLLVLNSELTEVNALAE